MATTSRRPRGGAGGIPTHKPLTETTVADAQTVKEIERLVQAAAPARRIVQVENEPDGVYYVAGDDGGMERVKALDEPEASAAADLATLAAVARRWKDDDAHGLVEVWYDRAGVVAVAPATASTTHGNDTCALTLTPSPQLDLLAKWRAAQSWQGYGVAQRELVALLRTLFAGCWGRHPTLLDSVRRLRTSKSAEAVAEVQRGKASLGKSMTAEASGAADVPELVTFEVPVFAGAAVRVTALVRVVLDPDPETERFAVTVLPDEIDAAFALGEERVQTMLDGLLEGSGIPVYHGRP